MHRRRVSDWPGTPTAESGSGTVTACDRRGRDCGNLNLPEPRGFIPVTVMMATVAVAVTERPKPCHRAGPRRRQRTRTAGPECRMSVNNRSPALAMPASLNLDRRALSWPGQCGRGCGGARANSIGLPLPRAFKFTQLELQFALVPYHCRQKGGYHTNRDSCGPITMITRMIH